jgi:hypothetical protein
LLVMLLPVGCSQQPDPSADRLAPDSRAEARNNDDNLAAHQQAETLEWDDLIPPDWQPEPLMCNVDVDNLSDDDPRALELMDKLRAEWSEAPMVGDLDDRRVRLPGFVVPVEINASAITKFLLVPYFGACIHVPPPPPNQIVFVKTADGRPYRGGIFDTVWVTGRMRVTSYSSELGEAGYRIDEPLIRPYKVP